MDASADVEWVENAALGVPSSQLSLLFPTILDTDDRIPHQHTIIHRRLQGQTKVGGLAPHD